MAKAVAESRMRSSWVWMALLALVSIIGGILALWNPLAATLTVTLLAGWVFLFLGVVQIVQSFGVSDWTGFIWALLLGIATAAVGIVLLFDPLAGMVSLTILVAVIFFVSGIAKAMFAFSLRPVSGWGWVLASAVVSILLGVMIVANFPWSAVSVLGILLGVELLSTGVLYLFAALGLRKLGQGA